jgi:thymidine kinase
MKQEFIIFTGPMFGGKTSRMLSQLERAKYQRKVIKLFKPVIDNRYASESVVCHNGKQWQSISINNGQDIYNHASGADVIAVDEAFMIPGIADALLKLYTRGKQIYVSSLQLSSEGTIFPEMAKMFPWATKIEVCPAVCYCGEDAYYTISLTEKQEEVRVGGKEGYEPRCKEHAVFMRVY